MHATVETATLAQEVTRAMQKRMEDAIQQFVATARIMNDGLLICDQAGGIIAFNPAAQRMFGLPDEPTMKVNELFQHNGGDIDADDLWRLGRAKKRILTGRNDQGLFPTHIRVSVLDRADGTSVVLLIVQDLTLIERTFNTSQNAYVIVAHNEIIAANAIASRIFGYGPDELLGKDAESIVASKDRSGEHLDLTFELAKVQWEGEEGLLITIRQAADQCPTCGQRTKHAH